MEKWKEEKVQEEDGVEKERDGGGLICLFLGSDSSKLRTHRAPPNRSVDRFGKWEGSIDSASVCMAWLSGKRREEEEGRKEEGRRMEGEGNEEEEEKEVNEM